MQNKTRFDCGLACFALSTLAVLYFYMPLLMPLIDPDLGFAYGDFTTMAGNDSAQRRVDRGIYAFNDGGLSSTTNRAFLVESPSLVSAALGLNDAQTHSILILACILLGSYGIYRMVVHFCGSGGQAPLLTAFCILFYFLNIWSIERIGYIWIWLTYAIMPAFVHCGIRYAATGKPFFLASYSLMFSVFGMIPHSLIYLLALHALLGAHSLLCRKPDARTAFFLFGPILAYALANLPVITLFLSSDLAYPTGISESNMMLLSQNGRVIDIITLSNSWSYSFSDEKIIDNPVFRVSALSLLLLILFSAINAYRRLEKNGRLLVLLSLAMATAALFIAQGMNNAVFGDFLMGLDGGQLQLFATLREWGRICVLIPPILVLALSVAFSKAGDAGLLSAMLLFVLAVQVASSPIFEYVPGKNAAVEIPGDYNTLANRISSEYKAYGTMPVAYYSDLVWNVYSWNHGSVTGPIDDGIASKYPPAGAVSLFASREAPPKALDTLDIRYIVRRRDIWGEYEYPPKYAWFDCEGMEYFDFCENPDRPEPFSVFSGTILAGDDPAALYSVGFIGSDGYVPSSNDSLASFVLAYGNASADAAPDLAASVAEGSTAQVKKAICVLEAETHFKTEGAAPDNMTAVRKSYGEALLFPDGGTASADFGVLRSGTYMVALRGSGEFRIDMGNESLPARPDGYGFAYAGPVELREGAGWIGITAGSNSSLDVVWIYETEGNATLDEILDSDGAPAVVEKYARVNPTLWTANISASRPFVLAFAETWYPGWEARMYRGGELVEVINPVKLYGVMQGYHVGHTGDMRVDLVFAPQETYSAAMAVSAITVFGCLAYISFCIWRGDT